MPLRQFASSSWQRAACALAVGAALQLAAPLPAAQRDRAPAGGVVLRYDFQDGAADWRTTFPGAQLRALPDPTREQSANQVLEFAYTANPTASAAFYTLQARPAPGASTVRFWMRASEPTPLQFALGDRNGAGYYYALNIPAGEWTQVSIPLADLNLVSTATGNPARFDPAALRSVRFQDLSRYHTPAERLGERRIWLDNLEFVSYPTLTRHDTRTWDVGRGITIDNFDGAVLGWEADADLGARLVPGQNGGAARLSYRQARGERTPSMVTHLRGARLLPGMKSIRLVARSQREARLRLSLMEYLPDFRSVPYEATVTIPAGREWRLFYVPVTAFRLAAGAADANNRFDPDQVWLMRVADVTSPEQPADNVLELDEIGVVREAAPTRR